MTPPPSTEAPAEVVVGVPEANAAGAELGIGQFANLLSYESLTENSSAGRPLPRLAESWRWENNDQRLRVFLRRDVTLHDGSLLTAPVGAELVRSAVTNPRNLARYTSFNDIAAVRSDGDFQLVFDVIRPSAMLAEDLTVPLDVKAEGRGTGAYRVTKRSPNELILERWDKYYLGQPSIRRVVMRPFGTLRTTWTSLLRREVDLVSDIPADAVEFIRSDDVQVVPLKRWYQFVIAFNSRQGPLRSAAVRQALNIAIDREALIRDVLRGSGSPSYGPLWPEYWAHDSSITPPMFDPALATSLLEEAGYKITTSPNPAEAPARLRFTCLIPENFSVWERIALKVQKDLFNVGVDMRFKVVPFEEFNLALAKGDFEAALLDMISGPTPGRAYIFWASARRFSGVYNVFGYENAESERLFDILRTSRNEAAVRSATRRLQRVLLDDPPALFLAWNERARAVRREFAIPEEGGRDPILSLWRWTRRPDTLNVATQ
jgi:peptide/nickel transport system substrate-binding protein